MNGCGEERKESMLRRRANHHAYRHRQTVYRQTRTYNNVFLKYIYDASLIKTHTDHTKMVWNTHRNTEHNDNIKTFDISNCVCSVLCIIQNHNQTMTLTERLKSCWKKKQKKKETRDSDAGCTYVFHSPSQICWQEYYHSALSDPRIPRNCNRCMGPYCHDCSHGRHGDGRYCDDSNLRHLHEILLQRYRDVYDVIRNMKSSYAWKEKLCSEYCVLPAPNVFHPELMCPRRPLSHFPSRRCAWRLAKTPGVRVNWIFLAQTFSCISTSQQSF